MSRPLRAERRMNQMIRVSTILLASLLFGSCHLPRYQANNGNVHSNTNRAAKVTLRLTSPAFKDGDNIPKQYTCDGANSSPPLTWSGVPPAAKSLAIITDDPDAPGKAWVH